MKKNLLLLFALFQFVLIMAAPRTMSEIKKIAENKFQSFKGNLRSASSINDDNYIVYSSSEILGNSDRLNRSVNVSTEKNASSNTDEAFYLFQNKEAGYVVVSADEEMEPVLAYSAKTKVDIENIPDNMKWYLSLYVKQAEQLRAGIKPIEESYNRTATIDDSTIYPDSVAPLAGDILYDQSYPYNEDCPLIDDEHTIVGCTAVAMGMILKYYQYPDTAKGVISYSFKPYGSSNNVDSIKVDVNLADYPFDWNNILKQYNDDSSTEEEKDAISNMLYMCGLSCKTIYGLNGSWSTFKELTEGLLYNMKYDENIKYLEKRYCSCNKWLNILKKEFSSGRIVAYGGDLADFEDGHAFVADGYDKKDFIHFNWGWSGYGNGYYHVVNLAPSFYYDFNLYQRIVYQIKPPTGDIKDNRTDLKFISDFELKEDNKTLDYIITLDSIKIKNFSINKFVGNIYLMLEGDNNVYVLDSVTINSNMDFDFYEVFSHNFSAVSLPKNINDGTYKLYFTSKGIDDDVPNEIKSRIWNSNYANLIIKDNKVFISKPNMFPELVLKKFDCLTPLYSTTKTVFEIEIENKNEEDFLTTFHMYLKSINHEKQDTTILIYNKTNTLLGATVNDMSFIVDLDSVPSGDYSIYLSCYNYQTSKDSIFESSYDTINVKEGIAPIELALNESLCDSAISLTRGEDMSFTINVKNTGMQYLNSFLLGRIYSGDYSDSLAVFYYTDFVLKPSQDSLFVVKTDFKSRYFSEIDGFPEAGNYNFELVYYDNGFKSFSNIDFSTFKLKITDPSAEINYVEKNEVVVYSKDGNLIVNSSSENNISNIQIYDLTSRLVYGSNILEKDISIPLSTGFYIVKVKMEDGKNYTFNVVNK